MRQLVALAGALAGMAVVGPRLHGSQACRADSVRPMSSTFGRWLVELGALPSEAALADVLARQSERLPTASVAYVLGYAPERTLAGVLAAATGRPAIVLDESVVDVGLLAGGD